VNLCSRHSNDLPSKTKREAPFGNIRMGSEAKDRPFVWIRDEMVSVCQSCSAVEFSSLNRKHHCRSCGKVVCHDCSKSRMLIPIDEAVLPPEAKLGNFDQRVPQKCCVTCTETLRPLQDHLRSTIAHCSLELEVERNALSRYFNNPTRVSLQDEIIKATHTLRNFTEDNKIEGEDRLPRDMIRSSVGLVFITLVRVGFLFTGTIGSGLVVAKRPDGSWSAPSALASLGIGWGLQFGGEVTDVVILLNSRKAVEAFSGRGSVSIGTQLSICVGPVGRGASKDVRAGDAGLGSAFSYAHSKGLFVGASLEAGTIMARSEANRAFYGATVTPKELLLGNYPPPKAAESLYSAILEVQSFDSGSGLIDLKSADHGGKNEEKNLDILLDGTSRGGLERQGIFASLKDKVNGTKSGSFDNTEHQNKSNECDLWLEQRHKRILEMRKQSELVSGSVATEMLPLKSEARKDQFKAKKSPKLSPGILNNPSIK